MNSPKNLQILIVAGGTGGHLYPARHIGQAFREFFSDAQIEFIGAGRALEEKIIEAHGFTRHVVESAGVKGRGLRGVCQFLFALPVSVWQTWSIFRQFKPTIVIGVGGYVTVIPILLAALMRIPTIIHEAEINPGMANNFLAKFVTRISVAFENCTITPRAKIFHAGQPMRVETKRFAVAPPHLPEEIKNLLVIGGSLGAKAVDSALAGIAGTLADKKIEVWHQTRPENEEMVRDAYQRAALSAQVTSYITDIDEAYEWADIVIARAGANTVMELSVLNRPAILVPYPFAQDDHQTQNAKVLERQGKALIVQEGEDFPDRLCAAIVSLLDNARYSDMVLRLSSVRNTDAAERIVNEAVRVISLKI